MVIYKIQCKENNKIYVGQTTKFRKRVVQHKSNLRNNKHCNPLLQNSWNKYGEKSFIFEKIDTCKSFDELDVKEDKWINKLETLHPNGFNLKTGGVSCRFTDVMKEKIIKSNSKTVGKYDKEKRLLKVYPSAKDATKEINGATSSINTACRNQKVSYGYLWKYLSDDWNFEQYEGRIGKMIWQYDDKGNFIKSYNDITQCTEQTGLSKEAIASVANGYREYHKGYKFFYRKQDKVNPIEVKTNNKKVDQYTKDGKYIKTFDSITEAAKEVDTYPSGISAMLGGTYKTYKGYIWKYHE